MMTSTYAQLDETPRPAPHGQPTVETRLNFRSRSLWLNVGKDHIGNTAAMVRTAFLRQYFSVSSVEIETRARLPIENDENGDVIAVSWRIGDRDVSPTFDVLAIGPKGLAFMTAWFALSTHLPSRRVRSQGKTSPIGKYVSAVTNIMTNREVHFGNISATIILPTS